MTWFERLMGFSELSPSQVRENITLKGETLLSNVNGKVMNCGRLEMPSLGELRSIVHSTKPKSGRISVREVIADVQSLHVDVANSNALFQVASQFNLLEMVSPNFTPEQGIGIYENDHTQGPACAIAAGAGTIYRNYFAAIGNQIGQSEHCQIDCLEDLGQALGNVNHQLWQMKNGYALPSQTGLIEIRDRLRNLNETDRDELRQLLRIGIQWNTQVTLKNCSHQVSQAYCSALPVAYSSHSTELWEDFARLVLEASYEATLCAAILNQQQTGNNQVFLTMLGGGAFGNQEHWIIESIQRALQLYVDWDLDVAIVSYGRSYHSVQKVIDQYQAPNQFT